MNKKNNSEDAKMLAEIRKLVDDSKLTREAKANRGKSMVSSKTLAPYGTRQNYSPKKIHPSQMSSSLFAATAASSHNEPSKNSSIRAIKGTSLPQDALLRRYAAELRNKPSIPLTEDELRVKAVTLNHMNTMTKVDSFISINNTLNDNAKLTEFKRTMNREASSIAVAPPSSSFSTISTPFTTTIQTPAISSTRLDNNNNDNDDQDAKDMQSASYLRTKSHLKHISAMKLMKKYPRYCTSMNILNFNDTHLLSISPRSDPWMIKFMELCYDEAYQALNTPVAHQKQQQQSHDDFNKGSFDTFPFLVTRIISHYYSVLEVQKRVSLEILYTIEFLLEQSEFHHEQQQQSSSDIIRFNGGRALLFSKFLSEEYDSDMMALFVYSREIIQTQVNKRLKDMNPSRIYPTNSIKDSEKKIVPCVLPSKWYFVLDQTMSEAPLLSIHESILSHLLYLIAPTCWQSIENKQYLIEKIWDVTIFDCMIHTPLSYTNSSNKAYKQSLIQSIPIYSILRCLCLEWKRLSKEEKLQFSNTKEIYSNLSSLHTIYQNNCELMKSMDEEIRKIEDESLYCLSKLQLLEKEYKKYDRKWNRRLMVDHQHEYNLNKITELKELITKTQLEKLEKEQEKEKKVINRELLNTKIESLWKKVMQHKGLVSSSSSSSSASLSSSVMVSNMNKKANNNTAALWMEYIVIMFTKIIAKNTEEDHLVKQSIQTTKTMLASTIPTPPAVASMQPHTLPLPPPTNLLAIQSTITQTITRMFVRQVINEGKRKVMLKQYLTTQEHHLSLQYGNLQYIQQYQRQLIAQEQAKRKQYMLSCIPGIAKILFTQEILPKAMMKAYKQLYNVWWWLTVSNDRILCVNTNQWLSVMSLYQLKNKPLVQKVFSRLSLPLKIKLLQQKHHQIIYQWIISQWKTIFSLLQLQKQLKQKLSNCITIWIWKYRDVKYRNHLNTIDNIAREHYEQYHYSSLQLQYLQKQYLQYWYHTKIQLKQTYTNCINMIIDRNYLKSFYTWKHCYTLRKLKKLQLSQIQLIKCIQLQCWFRQFTAIQYVKQLKAHKTLRHFYKTKIQYSTIYTTLLSYFRKETENIISVKDGIVPYYTRSMALKAWKKLFLVKNQLRRLLYILQYHSQSCYFKYWQRFSTQKTLYLSSHIIKIQQHYRRYASQQHILHYYHWRTSFHHLQACIRGYLAYKHYQYDIYYYRKARIIQCLYRKYHCRKNFYYQRISAYHVAASENNYDRCKYYLTAFPEFIQSIDEYGNNALHNAAISAAKRTLKLLVKYGLPRNEYNRDGYTPLQLVITSLQYTPQRDDCFQYMLEHGFDDDQLTLTTGKTCLLLAIEYKQHNMIKQLLLDGHDCNIADYNGLSPLQVACAQGNSFVVNLLIENEVKVNQIGYNGTYSIHESILGKNIEVLQLLLGTNQLDLNVKETTSQQTALFWAIQHNLDDFVDLLVQWSASLIERDCYHRSLSHYVAIANSISLFTYLREYEDSINFDDNYDYQGNTPLHLAAYYNAIDYTKIALYSGIYPSYQNHEGNQPSHIAAQYNHLEVLQLLCEYDEHIGRLNYAHYTPLGLAKVAQASDCQSFLEEHYHKIEIIDGRNALGNIWWDKSIDMLYNDWEVNVNTFGERKYIHKITGEVRDLPPIYRSKDIQILAKHNQLPLQRKIEMIKEEDLHETGKLLTKHEYYLEYQSQKSEILHMSKDFYYATIITKYTRRKLAYLEAKRTRNILKTRKIFNKFFKYYMPAYRKYLFIKKGYAIVKIQALIRGYFLRKHYFTPVIGRYYLLKKKWAYRILRYQLWDMYTSYKIRCEFHSLLSLHKTLPETLADWEKILQLCQYKPERIVIGIYEEYLYPNTRNIKFYRNVITNSCSFQKPSKLIYYDEQMKLEILERKQYGGATKKQIALAIQLQALYRGYLVRNYYKTIEKAYAISQTAKDKYLFHPEIDINLYNYALYVMVFEQDIDHTRRLFIECFNRMQYKGPDIAFVLYSYCIFAMKSQDEEIVEIMQLLDRGKKAEESRYLQLQAKLNNYYPTSHNNNNNSGSNNTNKMNPNDHIHQSHYERIVRSIEEGTFQHGRIYDIANTGFFKYAAGTFQNSFGWECYAICRFLIYNDFKGAYDAFMHAFTIDAENTKLKQNFDIMMTHYYGNDEYKKDQVMKEIMQAQAKLDADQEENRRVFRDKARLRRVSASRIQIWYRARKQRKGYDKFMELVRQRMKDKKKLTSRGGTR